LLRAEDYPHVDGQPPSKVRQLEILGGGEKRDRSDKRGAMPDSQLEREMAARNAGQTVAARVEKGMPG